MLSGGCENETACSIATEAHEATFRKEEGSRQASLSDGYNVIKLGFEPCENVNADACENAAQVHQQNPNVKPQGACDGLWLHIGLQHYKPYRPTFQVMNMLGPDPDTAGSVLLRACGWGGSLVYFMLCFSTTHTLVRHVQPIILHVYFTTTMFIRDGNFNKLSRRKSFHN